VNGREREILRANYAFRAVPVPAGRSRIELTYVPRGLVGGAVISALTAVGLCAIGVLWLRERRRSRRMADGKV
jgi:uncharacterized membrane protein YfhO